jgi:capsular polysaccharide biosynthesis protein
MRAVSIQSTSPVDGSRSTEPEVARLPGLAAVLRRRRWALGAAALGLVAGGILGLVRDPVYESTTYVTVTATSGSADAFSTARAAQALARIATAPEVVSGPLREAGLADVAEQPRLFITVQAAPDAPLISVTGAASAPREARAIAATVAATLASIDTLGPFQAFQVADPSLPGAPSTPWWVVPAGGTGLGLGIGLLLAATVPPRRSPSS